MDIDRLIRRTLVGYYYSDNIKIVDIRKTVGNVGIYVKWNFLTHDKKDICQTHDWQFISNEQLFSSLDYESDFPSGRAKKLKFLELKSELQ